MRRIKQKINYEGYVQRAELNARLQLGLKDDEAIEHYNNWMKKFNLNHLIIK